MQKIVACVCVFIYLGSHAQIDGQEALEFSKDDVFANQNWDSLHVSVLGIRLGMSRSEAVSVVKRNGYESPQCGMHKPGQIITEDICSIYKNGQTTFVDLKFQADHVIEIRLQLFVSDAGGVLWIAKSMVGSTKELATKYSDELRNRLLGREEMHCVENPRFSPPSVQTFSHNYDYWRRGFGFDVVEVDNGQRANGRFKIVELYFYLRQPNITRK